jgi:hypothetical protein
VLLALDAFDERVTVAIDDDVEDEWAATHGTILDEMLPAAAARIDPERVLFTARRTAVEYVEFERH